jgi:hypothetical protein
VRSLVQINDMSSPNDGHQARAMGSPLTPDLENV